MRKSTRIICLVIAGVFIATMLLSIVMSIAYADGLSSRGETVYVTADVEGNPETVISSVYLSNPSHADELIDYTSLTNIKVITSNEPPKIDGDAVRFVADGTDVSYQGTAAGELPFSVRLAYFLDGKAIDPLELAGKSGRVRIEVYTENSVKETVEVDGEAIEMYVPFSIICMLTLDDSFRNVSAENAKVSSQAGQITILSVLLPGLAESLGIEEGGEISDTLAIEADVENFAFRGGTFIGMAGVIDQNDLSSIDNVADLMNALSELNDAANSLYRGTRTLRNAMDEYAAGVLAYSDGVGEAASGVGELAEGAAQLYSGAVELAGGAGQLAGGSKQVTDGLKEVTSELGKIEEYIDDLASGESEALYDVIESVIESAAQEAIEAYREEARAALRESLKTAMPTADEEAIEAIVDSVLPASGGDAPDIELSEEQKKQIADAVAQGMQDSPEMQDAIKQVRELIDGMEKLADGSEQVTNGANELAGGAGQLAGGVRQIRDGLDTLAEGMITLHENGGTLASGADELAEGLKSITRGLRSLSLEGMQRLVDETAEIDVSLSRKDALLELSQSYLSFSATREPANGSVQFIITTEGIEEELPLDIPTPDGTGGDPAVEGSTEAEERTFFERIGDWFQGIFEKIGSWF